MNVEQILAKIDERAPALKLTDNALSLKMSNSKDTIRNWRRAVREGKGNSGVHSASIDKLATALGVSVAWLTEANPKPFSGFAENAAAPWRPKTPASERTIKETLAPQSKRPELFQLRTGDPGFGHFAGDILIVDMNAEAKQDDLVLANIVDLETGDGHTVLRRLLPPYIVPSDPEKCADLIDNNRVVIMGKVVASFRSTMRGSI